MSINVTIRVTKSFIIALKPLLKKYPSLKKDLINLEKELIANPKNGTPLGHNIYKIRLKISSKGRGKSGGARVISLLETNLIGEMKISENEVIVNLITIYDKADTAAISDKELKDMIKIFYQDK